MSDPTTTETAEAAPALNVAVADASTDWRDQALAALDAWASAHTHDNPLSRDTERYNAIHANLQSIRQTLSEV
jgi:hypothetical protein